MTACLSDEYEVLCALRYGRLNLIRPDVLRACIAADAVVENAKPGENALTQLGMDTYRAHVMSKLVAGAGGPVGEIGMRKGWGGS